jgi:hypothetical protein
VFELIGEAEVIDHQTTRLVAKDAVHSGDGLHEPMAGRISRSRTRLLVHRYDNSVFFKPLTAAQFLLLEKLAAGVSVSEACGELAVVFPKTKASDVQAWFANWTHLGFFARR